MTKSRRSSRSSARAVRDLVALLGLGLLVFCGCTTSTAPTYTTRDIANTYEKIIRDEYKTNAHARLVGKTLWVYLPVDKLFDKTSGKDPNDLIKERFEVQENKASLSDGLLSVEYLVKPIIPEREKDQGYKLNKDALDKITDAMEVMRRIIFSLDPKMRDEVQFYVLLAADVSNGLELSETIYYKDMIKVMYRLISPGEYHHRVPMKSGLLPEAIGNRTGQGIDFPELGFDSFICQQIEHRIGLKFQKPEVKQGIDMDKEIEKVVLETLRIYGFQDFRVGELTNLFTNGRMHVDPDDALKATIIR